jgi:hypothetical protein
MDMIIMKNSSLISLIIIVLLSWSKSYALQPFENDFEKHYVRQGYGQCGPASFYMIFKYYGDDKHNAGFFFTGEAGEGGNMIYKELNLSQSIPGKEFRRLTNDTDVAKWINGGRDRTEWNELTGQVKNLYFKNTGSIYEIYYNIISEVGYTENNKKGEIERTNRFLHHIFRKFLINNHPVIVHLKRIWPLSGHYLIIAGFDEAKQMVKFVDPNSEYGGILVQEIPLAEFIADKWYRSPSYPWWYPKAGWDGKWLGFYRE